MVDRVCRKDERGARNAYRILIGKCLEKHSHGTQSKWEDNIKINIRELNCEGRRWMQMSQDRAHWRASVLMVLNVNVLLLHYLLVC